MKAAGTTNRATCQMCPTKLYASSYISAISEIMKITFPENMSSTEVERLWFLDHATLSPLRHAFNRSPETGI